MDKQPTNVLAGRPLEAVTVAEAMTAHVIHCAVETRLAALARLMVRHGVHAIFVYDYGDEEDEDVTMWGVVTDLDVAAAAARGAHSARARELAQAPLVTVTSDVSLHDAAELMSRRGVSHLAVLDPQTERPAGVLSTLDVARAVAGAAIE
jgi:CBS domain-containing protein